MRLNERILYTTYYRLICISLGIDDGNTERTALYMAQLVAECYFEITSIRLRDPTRISKGTLRLL